jgi:hypothetical protein
MDFSVAVRAEHDALGELGGHGWPSPIQPVGRYTEVLRLRAPVVKFEHCGHELTLAAVARRAKHADRADLRVAAELDDLGQLQLRVIQGVTLPMAVRTDQVALECLGLESRKRSVETADPEFLRSGIPVMKFERNESGVISTVGASPSQLSHKIALAQLASLEQ